MKEYKANIFTSEITWKGFASECKKIIQIIAIVGRIVRQYFPIFREIEISDYFHLSLL